VRQFTKVSPQIWRSTRFRDLKTDAERLLYLYLLTCEHQNSAGCFRLPAAYAAADLLWSEDTYREALSGLIGADLVQTDDETQEVLVRRWFKHNLPDNPKHKMAVEKAIESVSSDELREEVWFELETAWNEQEAKKAKRAESKVTVEPANDPNSPGSRLLSTSYMNGRK
jgi:hypothetical protein